MTQVIRWTWLALADLVSIRDHIATGNPTAADATVAAVRDAVVRLTDFPQSGRIVPERRAQGYREIIVAPYRVVYSVVGGDVRVLRVWHGRRSMGALGEPSMGDSSDATGRLRAAPVVVEIGTGTADDLVRVIEAVRWLGGKPVLGARGAMCPLTLGPPPR